MRRMTFFAALCFGLILIPTESSAQFKYWRYIFEGNGDAVGINPLNPNTVYGQAPDRTLRRSYDRGTTWSAPLGSLPSGIREILVHPRDTNTIFTVDFFSGLRRSTDGGVSWNIVLNNFGIDGVSVDYDHIHPDTMFAGNFADAAVYRSIDRGVTWQLRGHASDGNICTIAVRPDSANIIYAGAGNGRISKSTNFGSTWRYVKPQGASETPRIVIDPVHPLIAYACGFYSPDTMNQGIFKTTDGGEHWFHSGAMYAAVWSLEIDPAHPDTVYAGTFGEAKSGVYATYDAGQSWTLLGNGFYPNDNLWQMALNSRNPENVYVAATTGNREGILRLMESDAVVRGTLRDSVTGLPITSGEVRLEPGGDTYAMNSSNGSFEFYRPAGDTLTAYSIEYYYKDTLITRKSAAFHTGSVVTNDLVAVRGSIEGTVFGDANADGILQAGENGLRGFTVTIASTTRTFQESDTSGHFQFSNLDFDTYTISVIPKYGFQHSGGSIHPITVSTTSRMYQEQNFGYTQLGKASSITPRPYSCTLLPGGSITATFAQPILPGSMNDSTAFIVRVSVSGPIRHGTIVLSAGNTVATYTPASPFHSGEDITVELTSAIHTAADISIAPFSTRFSTASTPGLGTFGAKKDYIVGTSPWGIAAGDLDGDGDNDIVVANFGSNSVSILWNSGKGMFGNPTNYAASSTPRCVAIGDIDNDGDQDIIVGNGSGTISVFINNGSGSFAGRVDHAAGGNVSALVVSDVDGDGRLDVVVSNLGPRSLSVLKNIGNGVFDSPDSYETGTSPSSMDATDFDGDGGTDMLIANASSSSTVRTMSNRGSGEFLLENSYPTSSFCWGIVGTDLNGDFLPDIAATNYGSGGVSIYANLGSGSFGNRTEISTGGNPWSIAAGDLNGDGLQDMVVALIGSNTISVLRNSGGSVFAAATYTLGTSPRMVALCDIDGDGKKDIIVSNYGSASISVLRNTFNVSATLTGGWNLVSAPVTLVDGSGADIFGASASTVFRYDGGYIHADILVSGPGYWIKSAGVDTVAFSGNPVSAETVSVKAKWNLVGSVSNPVAVGAVTAVPPAVIQSQFFGYGAGYVAADSLRPGQGYWVKLSQDGQIVISSTSAAPDNSSKTATRKDDTKPIR